VGTSGVCGGDDPRNGADCCVGLVTVRYVRRRHPRRCKGGGAGTRVTLPICATLVANNAFMQERLRDTRRFTATAVPGRSCEVSRMRLCKPVGEARGACARSLEILGGRVLITPEIEGLFDPQG
jgi:hypothetical protein